jgi:hypothetical protein
MVHTGVLVSKAASQSLICLKYIVILAEIPGVARDSSTNIHVLFLIRTVT